MCGEYKIFGPSKCDENDAENGWIHNIKIVLQFNQFLAYK